MVALKNSVYLIEYRNIGLQTKSSPVLLPPPPPLVGVPVGNNRMFYEWLQTAENTMSGEEKKEEKLMEQEVRTPHVLETNP